MNLWEAFGGPYTTSSSTAGVRGPWEDIANALYRESKNKQSYGPFKHPQTDWRDKYQGSQFAFRRAAGKPLFMQSTTCPACKETIQVCEGVEQFKCLCGVTLRRARHA